MDMIKKHISKVVVLFVLVVGFFMLKDSQHQPDFGVSSKKVEINGSSISGYKDGELSWRITADYVWAGRSKYLFRAQHITGGKLYDSEGKTVVKDLSAYKVRVNTKSKTLSAFKDIHAQFVKRNDRDTDSAEDSKISITSNELRYFSTTKRTYLYKDVKILQDDATIYPLVSVEVDNDTNVAKCPKGFRLESKNYVVTGNKLDIYIDDDNSHISKGVKARRIGRPTTNMEVDERERELTSHDTFLSCTDLWYSDVSGNRLVNAEGNISVIQNDKVLKGDSGHYNEELSLYELEGNVLIRADSIRWLLTESNQAFKNSDMTDSLDMPVTINAQKLSFNAETKELKLNGPLTITQPNKTISCRQLIYNDKLQTVSLKGNVIIKKDDDIIEAEQLTLNLEKEEFLAKMNVFAEFFLKKNRRD